MTIRRLFYTLTVLLAGVLGFGSGSRAALIDAPVPTNAYIQFAGLDWAWGGPCPYTGCDVGFGLGDLSYQSTQGWRLPTSQELALIPLNFESFFRFQGANVPAGGTDPVSGATFLGDNRTAEACASPYFSTQHAHCDLGNGSNGDWAGSVTDTSGGFGEQLYVRGVAAVPEPATLGLLGAGLAAMALARRRRG